MEWYSKTFNYGQDTIEYIFSTLKSICNTLDDINNLRYRLSVIQDKIVDSKDNKEVNSIKLTTIHSSKGLEWDGVFLIDSHMIPTRAAIQEKSEGCMVTYEEEVSAITRPRKKLHIIQPGTVNGTLVNGSPFIQEVKRILRYQKLEIKNQERKEQYLLDVKNDRIYAKRRNRYKLDDFKVGIRIKHKSYGICEFIEIDEETMIGTVRLKSGFNQSISMSSCMKGIIVEIVN